MSCVATLKRLQVKVQTVYRVMVLNATFNNISAISWRFGVKYIETDKYRNVHFLYTYT